MGKTMMGLIVEGSDDDFDSMCEGLGEPWLRGEVSDDEASLVPGHQKARYIDTDTIC